MPITHFPHGVSSYGVPVLPDLGARLGKVWGTTYFVDTTNGSNSNDGKEPDKAFSTIQKALDSCTADKGDRVYVRNGSYTETLGLSKDGVSLIGESHGVIVTGSTNAEPTLSVSGTNCLVANMSFAGVDTGVDFNTISITGSENAVMFNYFTDDDGKFQISITGGHETFVYGNTIMSPQGSASSSACIEVDHANRCRIEHNYIFAGGVVKGSDSMGIRLDAINEVYIVDNYAVGAKGQALGSNAFVLFDNGCTSAHSAFIANNYAHLFSTLVAESGSAVAAHGLGTADITSLAIAVEVAKGGGSMGYQGNYFVTCTNLFDTTGL